MGPGCSSAFPRIQRYWLANTEPGLGPHGKPESYVPLKLASFRAHVLPRITARCKFHSRLLSHILVDRQSDLT